MSLAEALRKLDSGLRPDAADWRVLALEAPLDELAPRAHRVRMRLADPTTVGYVVDRNINYSNVCDVVCTFCAFYRKPGHAEGYVLPHDEIYRKVEETIAVGGSGILMQGGLHPTLPLSYYTDLLRGLKQRFGIYLHCFSPPEIHYLAELYQMTVHDLLVALREAGLDSIPGGGGEILVDDIRRKVTTKCTGVQWLAVMDQAHRLGIASTATMMFGIGETIDHRLQHLAMVREQQQKTGGFLSFIPWTFQPDNTALGRKIKDRVADDEYLRWLAICRLHLDNIPDLQVSWLTHGLDVARRALTGGASDVGSVMIEENVITPAGASHRAHEENLRKVIEDAGFTPRRRNAGYVTLDRDPVPDLPGGPRPAMKPVPVAPTAP